MKDILDDIKAYVKDNIGTFHRDRIAKLQELKLLTLLSKKNPYLYKAMDLNTSSEVVNSLASAFMISAEETIFGNWLEGLAIFVAEKCYAGQKSTTEGIDLEMEKSGIRYIVSIKSGPNWSNSSSMAKLRDKFKTAIRVYKTSGNCANIEAVEGCCYGNKNRYDPKDNHLKICGQRFWEFVSGDSELYTKIIEPLGEQAHEKNETYREEYRRMINKFTKEFSNAYCDDEGNIDWNKIVRLNSGEKRKG